MVSADVPLLFEMDNDATFDFDERLLRTATVDGIAGLFKADDDSKKTESVLHYNKFVEQMQSIAPAVFEDLVGVDGDEE